MLNLEAQAYFDAEEFDVDGYQELGYRDQKIRHIGLHVAKAAGKLLRRDEETIVHQVIPDLATYRSQLINLLDEPDQTLVIEEIEYRDVGAMLRQRASLLFQDQLHLYKGITDAVVSANANLATYIERREHGATAEENQLKQAALYLDESASGLAWMHKVDLDEVHLARLAENLGRPLPIELYD